MSRRAGFDSAACRDSVMRLRIAGMSIPTIAKKLNVSVSTVSLMQPEQCRKYRLTDGDVAMCAELVNHGLTFKEIADKFEVSAITVSRKVNRFWYDQAISENMVLTGGIKND